MEARQVGKTFPTDYIDALEEFLEYPELNVRLQKEWHQLVELEKEILKKHDEAPKLSAAEFAQILNSKGQSRQLYRIEKQLESLQDDPDVLVDDPKNFKTRKRGAMKYLIDGNGKTSDDGYHDIWYDRQLKCLIGKIGARVYIIDPITGNKASKGYHSLWWEGVKGSTGGSSETVDLKFDLSRLQFAAE